jgi:hypothetical protein
MKRNFKILALLFCTFLFTEMNAQTKADSIGFKNAALNYINGWYDGDATKMELALHPMLHKISRNGNELNASGLIELTRNCTGCNPASRVANVEILDIRSLNYNGFSHAIIKSESAEYIDYIFLTKAYDRYQITHVLWDYKSVTGLGTDSDILSTVKSYVDGVRLSDSLKIFNSLTTNFSSGQVKCYFVIESFDTDWLKSYFRDFKEGFTVNDDVKIELISTYKGNLGVAKATSGNKTEFVQLAFINNKWMIYNISRNYYTSLKNIDIINNKVPANAPSGKLISEFDTRLHYNDDIQSYTLTTANSNKSYNNNNFKILSKKLYLAVNAADITTWPQIIRVRAISAFGDTVYQDFIIEKGDPMVINNKTATCQKASKSIIIDGLLDDEDWAKATKYNIDIPFNGETIVGGAPDCSGYFQTVWSDTGIFVAVTVTDDIRGVNLDPANYGQPWYQDLVEIYFDMNTDNLQDNRGSRDSYGHYQNAESATDGIFAVNGLLAFYQHSLSGGSYIKEVYVPWKNLRNSKSKCFTDNSLPIGFDVCISDNDTSNVDISTNFRNRLVWSNKGDIDENYINMDDAGKLFISGIPKIPGISTSSAQFDATDNIMLYPNPAENTITLKTNSSGLLSVSVCNISGRELLKSTIANNGQIDISSLAQGVYFANIYTGHKTYTSKLIVK